MQAEMKRIENAQKFESSTVRKTSVPQIARDKIIIAQTLVKIILKVLPSHLCSLF